MLLRQEKRCCQSESVDEPVAGTSTTTWKPKGTSRKALANTGGTQFRDAWCLDRLLAGESSLSLQSQSIHGPMKHVLLDLCRSLMNEVRGISPHPGNHRQTDCFRRRISDSELALGKPGKVNDLRKQTDVVQLRHSFILFLRDCSWDRTIRWSRWNCDQSSACFHHFPSYSSIIHPSFIHHSSIIFHHFPSFSIIFHHFPSILSLYSSYSKAPCWWGHHWKASCQLHPSWLFWRCLRLPKEDTPT